MLLKQLGVGADAVVSLHSTDAGLFVEKKFKSRTKSLQKIMTEVDIQKKAALLGLAPRVLGATDGAFTMEYIPGKTGTEYLRDHRCMSEHLQKQMVSTWSALRDAGINHGDVSLNNVFVVASIPERIIWLDYGKSKLGAPTSAGRVFALLLSRHRTTAHIELPWLLEFIHRELPPSDVGLLKGFVV